MPSIPNQIEYNPNQQVPNTTLSHTLELEQLGPIVVNVDGTMARISNWHEMGEFERRTAMRIIPKRNLQRMEKLKMLDDIKPEVVTVEESQNR
ncbi:hypothetical protein HDV02_006502 [Globomyces sp. JEL0801]|nr:hypothetical protein HDV02_006502 [Globomyces sp. JEL0801]